jgi:predicted KAP-like P-loop ATPase
MNLNLITDQALGEPGSDRRDGLGFEDHSKILSTVALETHGPFTIGILGEWGTGKTSLMHLIEQRLCASENVVTVWFNAWLYEQENHPVIPLIGSIIKDLREKRLRRSDATAKSIADALRAFAYGLSGSLAL